MARIVVPEKDGVSFGSGSLIDARGQFGLVVTNWHVVRDAAGQIIVEFPDGFKSPAQVVKTDKDWDLAALSIYRPRVSPLPVSAAVPQRGEWLTIGGYGGGDWRMSGGQCTQYLAPGVEFPHEMVELSTEARQGDSGGPILNQKGELAGVLFGSGPGYTSGSYGGRVLQFLATVVPGGSPGSDQPLQANLAGSPSGAATGSAEGSALAAASPPPPPLNTALHTPPPATSPPPYISQLEQGGSPSTQALSTLTPTTPPADSPLLSVPSRRDFPFRLGPAPPTGADEINPKVAVSPEPRFSGDPLLTTASAALPEEAPSLLHSSLPPRAGPDSAAVVDLNRAPPEILLAAAWRRIGGQTAYDQAKSALAVLGLLTVVVFFWRASRQPEPEHVEE